MVKAERTREQVFPGEGNGLFCTAGWTDVALVGTDQLCSERDYGSLHGRRRGPWHAPHVQRPSSPCSETKLPMCRDQDNCTWALAPTVRLVPNLPGPWMDNCIGTCLGLYGFLHVSCADQGLYHTPSQRYAMPIVIIMPLCLSQALCEHLYPGQ